MKAFPVPVRLRGVLAVVTRLGWGVADQAASSLSNFALGLYVARTFGASSFGAFTLAFVTYSVFLNASRGIGTDPLLVRFSGAEESRWREATAAATATALLFGVVGGIGCVAIGLLLPGVLGPTFVALGVSLPGLMLQDSWRFAFFAAHRAHLSFVNDMVWTVLLAGMIAIFHVFGGGIVQCLLAFGATAWVAALYGIRQAGLLPSPRLIKAWLREHRRLSIPYLLENISASGSSQVRSIVLAAVTGLAAVGYVRGAEILMGPFLVVLSGLSQVSVPEVSRVLRESSAKLLRFAVGLGGVQAAAAFAWGAMLLLVFPLGPGPALLGPIWAESSRLILPVTLNIVMICFMNAAMAGLRAMGVSRRSLTVQLTTSALYVVLSGIGAALHGAQGAVWGTLVANVLGTAFAWFQLQAAHGQHEAALIPVRA